MTIYRKPICVCGHFAFGENKLNGQTVKTKIITQGLTDILGASDLTFIDTGAGIEKLLLLPFKLFKAAAKCDNIIIMPAYKGLRVITAILTIVKLFCNVRVHYAVIGGWLAEFTDDKPLLRYTLRNGVDYIYVETSIMKKALEQRDYNNVFVMPNFKELAIEDIGKDTINPPSRPYKLCTFSRVMKKKGLEDVIEAVKTINESTDSAVFDLTIYGPVWHSETQWFEEVKNGFTSNIHYGGSVQFDKSVETIRNYFALVFPTRFYTEGMPGTIIDAYAAGVPVISSRWESFSDVIDDRITGYGYDFGNVKALTSLLREIAENPEMISSLKRNCIKKAETFLPENVMPVLIGNLR